MGIKYGFFDNQTIGVDELNQITNRLVSGGISSVYANNSFETTEINNSNLALLCGGVVPDSDTSLKVVKKSSSKIDIYPGLAFFDNGTSIELTDGGETLSFTPGVKNYVYLLSSFAESKCYPVVSTVAPSGGYYVELAEIEKNGTITDKRKYAQGRVPGYYGAGALMAVNLSLTTSPYKINYEGDTSHVFELGGSAATIKHACIYAVGSGASIGYYEFDSVGNITTSLCNTWDNDQGGALYQDGSFRYSENENHTSGFTVNFAINLSKTSGKLTITATSPSNDKKKIITVYLKLW